MSQTTLTSYFNSRKRAAADDILGGKLKKAHIEKSLETKPNINTLYKSIETVSEKSQSKVKSSANQTKHIKPSSTSTLKNEESSSSSEPAVVKKAPSAFGRKVNAANVLKEPSKVETVSTARKELSLGDIRKKLAGSSRLAELKASAERISRGIQNLKETTEKKNLKEFKSIDVEVPSSPSKRAQIEQLLSPRKNEEHDAKPEERLLMSPRKVVVSPIKSPNKVPAYLRHAALATPATSLPLPHHYRFLAEIFRGMETVVSLLHNRNEKITFTKLKPSVQEMMKRNFTEKHLAQIKQLVPDFYNFEVHKLKSFSTSSNKESYELVVTPNFPNDIKAMNPTVLLERRRYFYDTLMQLVKKHHSQYLLSLDPPMVIPDNKLTRWHPEFDIEKIQEVECAKLPELPNVEKCSSAQDVLSKARELFKCNTKMERALEKLAQAKARGLTDQEKVAMGLQDNKNTASTQTSQPTSSGATLLNPALRGLPASLLEKVRAKQAAKALEAMTRTSDMEQKYLVYCRLPDLARTLRNIYVTERKNVLALNVILSKLDSSFRTNVSAKDLERDITALSEEVPEWVKLHDVRNTKYLKLDKAADLKSVTAKLEALADKYKSK